MEKYEMVKDIGSGNFGVARLMQHKETKELVTMKHIPRGKRIDENVAGEIINHCLLHHPNIIRFKDVVLTPTDLAIVMGYAGGGKLFEQICDAGRFSEDEASPAPRLKICDFGYLKSSLLHSRLKSTVGTPAYIVPEVFSRRKYDGKLADVWSCGVTLYVMLAGAYAFEEPDDPRNFRKNYWENHVSSIQDSGCLSYISGLQHLLSLIFVASPMKEAESDQEEKEEGYVEDEVSKQSCI